MNPHPGIFHLGFKTTILPWILLLFVSFSHGSSAKDSSRFDGPDGPYLFEIIDDLILTDQNRQRQIPLRIFCPKGSLSPKPVLVFSHGMGGSKASGNWLGQYLAGHGYVCIFLTHFGSDSSMLDFSKGIQENIERIFQSFWSMKENLDRPQDVIKILDSFNEIETSRPALKGRLDHQKIGLAGHSFGAFTTLALAGGYNEFSRLVYDRSYEDARPKAFLAMSPPGTPMGIRPHLFFSKITRPTLIMTGSKDEDPGARRPDTAKSRLDAYHTMPPGNKYALWIEEAYHHTFADPKRGEPIDQLARKVIKTAALAFFNAYLKGDKTAREFLDSDRTEKIGSGRVTWYHK